MNETRGGVQKNEWRRREDGGEPRSVGHVRPTQDHSSIAVVSTSSTPRAHVPISFSNKTKLDDASSCWWFLLV
jgi:hypothetical protein